MDEDITWGFSVCQNRVKVHLVLTQIIQRKVMDNKLIYHNLFITSLAISTLLIRAVSKTHARDMLITSFLKSHGI